MAIVEERLQHISTTIDKLAKAGDEDVAASLDSNIREVTQAADNLQRECAALESELDRIEAMLNLLTTRNNESTSELNALAAIGEDVGEASHIVVNRKEAIWAQQQQCQILREKLGDVSSGATKEYTPRTEPLAYESVQWVNEGVQAVTVDTLPEPEGINDASDFKKVPLEEMASGIRRLQEMTPTITSGIGASSDYWAKHDRQKGLAYSEGYQKIYDAFYGGDAIKIDVDGSNFNIINGRHRIWLAKRLGVATLPMRVTRKATKN